MEGPRLAPAPFVEAEGDLVAAAVAGGVDAFAALYDLHADRVYRYLYYRLGHRADAEDLTQQVFLQAWQAIGRFRGTGAPFAAWLFTIAHNLVVNARKHGSRTEPLELDPPSGAWWADPETSALTQYDARVVRLAILRLKPEQQQVIILRFLEYLDYARIAALLGKSEANVRLIQHRALLALRALVAEEARSWKS